MVRAPSWRTEYPLDTSDRSLPLGIFDMLETSSWRYNAEETMCLWLICTWCDLQVNMHGEKLKHEALPWHTMETRLYQERASVAACDGDKAM